MRPLVCEWLQGAQALKYRDEYLLGSDILVAPLLEADAVSREVYLPHGRWCNFFTGKNIVAVKQLLQAVTGKCLYLHEMDLV